MRFDSSVAEMAPSLTSNTLPVNSIGTEVRLDIQTRNDKVVCAVYFRTYELDLDPTRLCTRHKLSFIQHRIQDLLVNFSFTRIYDKTPGHARRKTGRNLCPIQEELRD